MLHGFPEFLFFEKRIEIIASEINRLKPDIVFLQEVPWRLKTRGVAQVIAEKIGLNFVYVRANGNRWAIGFEEGEAILSRYPLKAPDFVELKPGSGFFENRVALRVTSLTEFGEVGLYVTHLTHDNPTVNQRQAEALRTFVDNQSVFSLVAGDFNATPDSPQILALKSLWLDAFDPNNLGEELVTCCNASLTQKDAYLTKRIDYIFLVPGAKMPEVWTQSTVFDHAFKVEDGWLWASDHVGLLLEIGTLP
jgi:endonuclease/exonuclease/phosphatase family metal-dependent hydrolase